MKGPPVRRKARGERRAFAAAGPIPIAKAMEPIASTDDAPLWSGYGLRIRTDVVLPGALPLADVAHGADVEIVHGSPPSWEETRAWGVYRVASADLFEIAIPGVARFTCLDRRRIVVDPVPGATRAHVADMLVATVLPALLWARGEIVLHAAAFLLPGASRAIAVAGVSGSGKSTALARALASGGRQIADDSVRVGLGDDGVIALGFAGGYFERVADADARLFRPVPPDRSRAACPLGMLAILSSEIRAPRRLSDPEAIEALLRHRHRPRIAALLRTEAALLPAIVRIARTVPIVGVPAAFSRS